MKTKTTGNADRLLENAQKAYGPCPLCGGFPDFAVGGLSIAEGSEPLHYLRCSQCWALILDTQWKLDMPIFPPAGPNAVPPAALATLPTEYDNNKYEYCTGYPEYDNGEYWHTAARQWIVATLQTLEHENLLFRVEKDQWKVGDGFRTEGGLLCQVRPGRLGGVHVVSLSDCERLGTFKDLPDLLREYSNPARIPKAELYELAAREARNV